MFLERIHRRVHHNVCANHQLPMNRCEVQSLAERMGPWHQAFSLCLQRPLLPNLRGAPQSQLLTSDDLQTSLLTDDSPPPPAFDVAAVNTPQVLAARAGSAPKPCFSFSIPWGGFAPAHGREASLRFRSDHGFAPLPGRLPQSGVSETIPDATLTRVDHPKRA